MITRLGAQTYRGFRQLDIALPPYAVIAGANGTGKSTLLDIPIALGDMLDVGVGRAFQEGRRDQAPRASRLSEVLHRERGMTCSLSIQVAVPEVSRERWPSAAPFTQLRYELQLRLSDPDTLGVESEFLDLLPQDEPGGHAARPADPRTRGWVPLIRRPPGSPVLIDSEFRRGRITRSDLSPDVLALSLIQDEVLHPASLFLTKLLRAGAVPFSPNCAELRKAQPPSGPYEAVRPDGRNLAWHALRLQERDPEALEQWLHIVRLAIPNVWSVSARRIEHLADLKLTYRYGDQDAPDHSVTSSGLSDGTLRVLSFTQLQFLEELPPLLTIEQPEDGIHPRAIDVVLSSLSALPATQVLVATHSPIVLAETPLQQLICMRRDEEGGATAVLGTEHPRLQSWQRDIDLGALFAAGVLS